MQTVKGCFFCVKVSERIWGKYRPTLINRLHKDLTDCVIRGINPQTLAAEYAEEFRVSKNAAANLLMTEYGQFAAQSNTDCLNDLGVEEYEIIETLDGRTCEQCQGMDKKHFPMAQLQVGVNAPPFHNGAEVLNALISMMSLVPILRELSVTLKQERLYMLMI